MIVNENENNINARDSLVNDLVNSSSQKGLKSPVPEPTSERRRSRRLSGASAEFEPADFERSVEKRDKSNRRMTVDPNDILDLNLDDEDEEDGAVEEETVHTTRSEPNRKSSVTGRRRRMSRRATIEPEDITALLNDSTTSSKMEALTTASPASNASASRRSSRASVGSSQTSASNVSGVGLEEDTDESVLNAPKNDRRATMDAMDIDDILNEDQEEATSVPLKGRRHSVASIAHEHATLEFKSGNGIKSHFYDDGNTQMTHLSSATIASMAPSETQNNGLTAVLAGADLEDQTEPARRRQTMMEGRQLGLPSPSPLKPRAQSLAPGDLPFARFASDAEHGAGDATENLTTRTEPVGSSSAAVYRPKSAMKGARRSSAMAEGHSVEFAAGTTEDRDDTGVSVNSRYVMFGSPKAAEFDKEGPSNALTPLDKADAKAMFSMNGTGDDAGEGEEDSQTEQNSTILEQWDRLTNDDSGSENEDDEIKDRSGPLPTLGASRRSSIGLSSRRSSLGGGLLAPADLLHFDNTEELTAHSVIGRYSIGSTTDKTAELEPDLMAMLQNYDHRQEEMLNEEEINNQSTEEGQGGEVGEMVPVETVVDGSVGVAAKQDAPETSYVVSTVSEQALSQEEADSDASTEEEGSIDRGLHNTSMSFSLMLNDSAIAEGGVNVLDRLKSLNSSSRRTTLDHASRTPTGSRLSLNRRRATIRSKSKTYSASKSKILAVNSDVNEAADDNPIEEGEHLAPAIDRHVVCGNTNEASFIEEIPPVLQSPVSGAKSEMRTNNGKRYSRSAPASPELPLSHEKQPKRSRKKSPGKTLVKEKVSLKAVLDSCGPLQPEISKGDESMGSVMAAVANEASERCHLLPAYSVAMEAIIKHTAETSAVAKCSVNELPAPESQWKDCNIDQISGLSESTLLAMGQSAIAEASNSMAKERNKLLDAVARQLERKAKEIRNRAKTIRRASVKLLTLASPRKGEDTLNAEMLSAQVLADVQAEVHLARRRIEDISGEIEKVSDETSVALEEKKERLVIFTKEYSQKTDTDKEVSERLQELDSQLTNAEDEMCDSRTKIGVMQSITHHKLKSFRPSLVSFDCSLSAGLKAVVDIHVKNDAPNGYFVSDVSSRVERTSIHSSASSVDAGNENAVSENMAAALFYSAIFGDKDGPLSQAAIKDLVGQPFMTVRNTAQAFAGYISSFRLVLSKLKLFSDDGWNWILQSRDIVMFSPDDRHKLIVSMEVLISGNMAALSTQCLRNREDRPVAELPIKAVVTSLRNKYAGTLQSFPAAAFKREIDSILKYL